jgi:mRNA interferase MazF
MIQPNRSEILLIDLGVVPNQVVGHEQANRRPCLVIQTLDYSDLAVVIPFTSVTLSPQIYSIVKVNKNLGGLTSDSYALCHQIRSVSYKRIVKYMGILPERDFNKVLTVLSDFLDID